MRHKPVNVRYEVYDKPLQIQLAQNMKTKTNIEIL